MVNKAPSRQQRRLHRLLDRLGRPGAGLYPLSGEKGWGIFIHHDRRRRPLETLCKKDMHVLRAQGALTPMEDGGYSLSAEGRLSLQRSRTDRQAFASQHRLLEEVEMMEEDGSLVQKTVNITESPLGWLRRRGGPKGTPYLDEDEYAAGERLREDYWRSNLSPRMAGSVWEKQGGRSQKTGGLQEASAAALDARKRVFSALDVVGSPLNRVLVGACLREQGLDALEQAERWPRRSAKAILKLALGRLARHYGYCQPSKEEDYGFIRGYRS